MKFYADLCRTIWQFMIGLIVASFLYAYVTDTLIASDLDFSIYYLIITSGFITTDVVLRYLWKKKQN